MLTLMKAEELKDFRLVGGTGLSLHLRLSLKKILKRRFPLDEFDGGRHQQAAAGDGGNRGKQLYPGQ